MVEAEKDKNPNFCNYNHVGQTDSLSYQYGLIYFGEEYYGIKKPPLGGGPRSGSVRVSDKSGGELAVFTKKPIEEGQVFSKNS